MQHNKVNRPGAIVIGIIGAGSECDKKSNKTLLARVRAHTTNQLHTIEVDGAKEKCLATEGGEI